MRSAVTNLWCNALDKLEQLASKPVQDLRRLAGTSLPWSRGRCLAEILEETYGLPISNAGGPDFEPCEHEVDPAHCRICRHAEEEAEAYANLKPCRCGKKRTPANTSRDGTKTRKDGTPILRSMCNVCTSNDQARLHVLRKKKLSLDVKRDA